ncbi:formin-like protein 18 [Canna indica]|uniref:Formin-like protein 18 n=1 Tax=Canna indica TaxID=4628 RepID=A0AAQ3JVV1_9LILI|nr:formin-like protein 18 [Canna indica]
MVSDQEIASCVESVLRQPSDPAAAAVSLPGVVRQVEAKLGVDLSHKAAFIRDQIELLLGPARPAAAPSHPQAVPHQQTPPPVTASHNPYFLLHHLPLQQQIPPSQPASSAGVAAPAPFSHQHHPGIAFQYSQPPPLPAAAVVAAYHLQQHLHQGQHGAPAAVRPPPVTVAVTSPKESAPPKAKRRGGPGGLNKVCGVSPELQPIVGEAAMSRTQIVKQLWAYIRKNNLQDPNNKRKIICNDELRRVFETDSTDMFKMNKLLAKHIIPLDYPKNTGPESKKLKTEDVAASDATEPDSHEYPLVISDALANFFGSEQREMLQSEALSRIWDYIKANQLEDPANTSILCDSKLQELFGCESLPVTGIPEMLGNHLFKKS